MKTFHLTVAKIDESLFDGSAVSVTVPAVEGEMTILAEHTAFISSLKKGVITVRTQAGEQFFQVENGGTIEVSSSRVTVLL